MDKSKQNISPTKRGDYILLNPRRKVCDKIDNQTIKIDSIGEETLFKANQELYNKTKTQLPAYPRPSNDYTYHLGYSRY